MKKIVLGILALFSAVAFSQSKRDSLLLTKNEWVSKDLNYLRFYNDSVVYNFDNNKSELLFDVKNNKLTIKMEYRVGGTDFRKEAVDFKIKQLDGNKLVLEPLTGPKDLELKPMVKFNPDPLLKDKQYIFYNRGQLISNVDFKKITFHASTCFGTCPSMSVEVNRDGTVFYQGRIYTKDFTGNFTGQLSHNDMVEFHKILNRSQLFALDEKWKQLSRHNDTPRYNYIIELQDGRLVEINTNDQHPILDSLSEFLLAIPEKADLARVPSRHDYATSTIEDYRVSQH